jgi:hypothetical protein
MASLGGTFDATNVEPSAPIEILPPGKYPVQIVKSEMKDTKAGTGQLLALEMEIIDGPAKGRKLWENLNLVNPNPQAQEIAQRTLSAICHAVGRLQVSDSEELHFKPMIATVEVEPEGPDKNGVHRKARNSIKGFSAASGATAAPSFQPQQRPVNNPPPPPQAAARPASAAPWRRPA